jgi:choline dehydrogenase-like flavoprotein
MIRDFARFDGSEPIRCDLCIAGAGAVGISMALEFADRAESVVVLESGGLEYEEASQDLYAGCNIGHPYFDLESIRVRIFGGSTNHWGGMCTPFEPLDFERREWVPYSGWPITLADLESYYVRAHRVIQLGPYNYDVSAVVPPEVHLLPFRPDRIRPKLWRYSTPPLRFGIAYREPIAKAANIDVLLHANLIEIETDAAASSVSAFRIASLDGKQARVEARLYVLALGGLENPRLLLSSDRTVAAGLGNQRDLVGRFFMEHIRVEAGNVLSTQKGWHRVYSVLPLGGDQMRCALTPSPEMQIREEISHSMLMFGEKDATRRASPGYEALRVLKENFAQGRVPDHLGKHLLNVLEDVNGIARGLYEMVDPAAYVMTEAEQVPNPDSRVLLGRERDRLDLRRIEVDWRLTALDKRSIRTLVELVGQELPRLGVGRVQMAEWLAENDDAWSDGVTGHFHHMGTTRMASDASRGVVDADCRLFGVSNLYVGGSSVFVTGGCSNPTLTVVALALRLADHLKLQLAQASSSLD